jgi:aryl-alcohol dehydrogenase-like predicted oxidoreductase
MNHRLLGRTGLYVSELCFGAMTFGGEGICKAIGTSGQAEADALVGRCLEAGINFFDTADVYSNGVSEQLLGKALGARRQDIVLATKVRGRVGPGPNQLGLSRGHILQSVEGSLKRLGTDYIDLYQIHGFDAVTPLDEMSGKYRRGQQGPEGSRRATFDFPPVNLERAYTAIGVMDGIARQHQTSVARVALAWLLHQPPVTAIVIGAKTREQLEDNLEASRLKLTAEPLAALNTASTLPAEYPGWMLERQGQDRAPKPQP